eukprot:4786839-Karenia_brevis.AAC.1
MQTEELIATVERAKAMPRPPGLDVISPSAAMAMPDGKLSVTKGPAVAASSDIAQQAAPDRHNASTDQLRRSRPEEIRGKSKVDPVNDLRARRRERDLQRKFWLDEFKPRVTEGHEFSDNCEYDSQVHKFNAGWRDVAYSQSFAAFRMLAERANRCENM